MKEEFTEKVGDPSELLAKAKDSVVEAGTKLKDAAQEEWAAASEKIQDLKESFTKKDVADEAEAPKAAG